MSDIRFRKSVFKCLAYGVLAEFIKEGHLKKGDKFIISGKIQMNKRTPEIIVRDIQIMK